MGVGGSEGTIFADIQLSLATMQAQVDQAVQLSGKVGNALKAIPDAKPMVDTRDLSAGAETAKKLAQEVADTIGKLTGGRIGLDISQLETAGASAETILGTLGTGFTGVAATAVTASATIVAAFIAVEHELVEMGEHWEAAFRKVSVATGLTGHDLEAFEQSAVNVAKVSAASTENITAAMSELQVRLGLTGPALEAVTTSTTKFAKVTGQDAGDAAKALSQILTQFHIPADQAAASLDILLRVSQQTKIPMTQLEEQLRGRLAPTLQALGFDLAGTALLIGNMAKQGEAGRAAIQAFNKILADAAAAGKDPKVVFAELVEQLKTTGDVSTATGSILAEKLGARGFAFLSGLAKNGGLDVKEAGKDIQASGDTVNAAFDRVRSGADKISAQLTILKAQFAPIGIEIAKLVNALEEDLATKISAFTASIKALQDLASKVPVSPQVTAAIGAAPALALGPAGIPIIAQAVAQAGQSAEDTHAAEAAHAADAAAHGQSEALGVVQIATANLSKEIAQLQNNLADTHGQEAQIRALLQQKQTLEETQKAISALPPALAAQALAQVSAAEAAVEQAKANVTAAASYDEAAKATAAQAAAASDAADAQARAAIAARDAATDQTTTQTLLTRAYGEYAAVEADATAGAAEQAAATKALEAAQAAYEAATLAATAAAQAGVEATTAQIDAANKLATAKNKLKETLDAEIVKGAEYAVQQERTNAIISAAKPFLDAQSEAAIKVAEAQGNLTQAITIAGKAMGLTDEQIRAIISSLGASQKQFDESTNSLKALTVPLETLQARLGELATGAYPNLSRAQADALQQTVKSGDATREAAALAATYGVSVDELNSHLDDSKAHFDEWAKQVAAANRPLADYFNDETKSRITSGLGALASGADAGTAALAKQLEQSGHASEALALLAGSYGASRDQAEAWAKALTEGGSAAELAKVQMQALTAATGEVGKELFAAKEQLAAFTTFARDPQNGTIRLKVDIDLDAAKQSLADLQQTFREANTQRADVESKATHDFQLQQTAVAQQQNQVVSDRREALLAISHERTASTEQLSEDLAAVSTAANKASASISASAAKAQHDYTSAITDASVAQQVAFINAQKTYQDGVKALQDQTNQAIEAAATAAAAGLQQLSAAMTSFNQQQVQNAFTASVALQTAQNTANGFTDTQSVASAVRSAQVQAEGAAGIAQQNQATALAQAQNSVAQQQLAATQTLTKALDAAALQMQALAKAQKDAQNAALVQAANAQTGAARTLGIAQIGQTAYDASTLQGKSVVMLNGQPYVVDTVQAQEATAGTKPGGLIGQAQDAQTAAVKAFNESFDRERKRQQQLDEQQIKIDEAFQKEQRAFMDEKLADPLGKFRTRAQQEFDSAEKDRHKAQADADKAFLKQEKLLDVQIEALAALKAMAEKLKNGGGQINGPVTIQETSKDMLTYASTRAPAVLKV